VDGGETLATEWTIREVLNWTRGYFEAAGIIQPRLEAEILLAHSLDVDRLHLYLTPDKPLTAEERARYRTVVQKRHSGTPLQHLTGEVSFYGLRFRVRSDALIPRPETEELLDQALKLAPRDTDSTCLDLGTGSGVIAVCLARYLPRSTVTAVDVSPETLTLAQENARLNEVDARIRFVAGDWFDGLNDAYDLIVSNPPYVDEASLDDLPREVRDHEPRAALDGGRDGVEQIARVVRGAPAHLTSGGHLLLEIGHDQAAVVTGFMETAGFTDVRVEADLAGKDRLAVARWP